MVDYHMDEATFDLPHPWEDQSIQALSLPLADGERMGVTISRERILGTASLESMVDRLLAQQQQKLDAFELVSRTEVVAGGEPAVEAVTTWRHRSGPIFQRQIFVAVHGKLIAFTATAAWKHRAATEDVMHHLADSLRFREPP